ncbi:MAG TPA: hypothetical protein VNO17_09810 [Actinomycetota bacterium]|nr:hypothetical protein [Actinomycetota bacterium]
MSAVWGPARALSGGPVHHVLRRRLSLHPALYLPLARWKSGHTVLDRDTRLVIDGFTRSAGTFAAIAFQLAQDDHVRVAHHMHAAAALVAAARRGVPTLVTVRAPEPTIVSAMVREPGIPAREWLRTYVAFYERIAPYRSAFVIGTFEEVTRDLGALIDAVNERFGTGFARFEHSEENVRTVFRLIDERAAGPPWQPHLNRFISGLISAGEYLRITQPFREADGGRPPPVPEHRVQRPSPEREAGKEEARRRYRAPGLAGLRRRAEAAYRAVAGHGASRRGAGAEWEG